MTPLVYEINTRCWLNELAQRAGSIITLANVPESEFERWNKLGFTHLWLMGVWTAGPRSRAVAAAIADLTRSYSEASGLGNVEVVGSPYAIADYRVAALLGGPEALARFRARLHEHGMGLFLDFVPNHVGLDHEWLNTQPTLFVQSSPNRSGGFQQQTRSGPRWIAHGRDPNFPPWSDTAQLDYRVAATQDAMRRALLEIAGQCDGVRCDMAMLILNDVFAKTWEDYPVAFGADQHDGREFWELAISDVRRAFSNFIFMAEVYWGLEPRLQKLGFDFTYDKTLYDDLVQRNVSAVQRRLLDAPPEFVAKSAHFLENHDEPRIASILSIPEHRAAAWLILSLPGLRLLHEGQPDGSRVRVPVQFAQRCVEHRDVEIERLYNDLLGTLRNSSIGQGIPRLLRPHEAWAGNPSFVNIIVVQWIQTGGAFDMVAVNLASHRSQCRVSVDLGDHRDVPWTMASLTSDAHFEHPGETLDRDGLYFDIEQHGVQVFRLSPSVAAVAQSPTA